MGLEYLSPHCLLGEGIPYGRVHVCHGRLALLPLRLLSSYLCRALDEFSLLLLYLSQKLDRFLWAAPASAARCAACCTVRTRPCRLEEILLFVFFCNTFFPLVELAAIRL